MTEETIVRLTVASETLTPLQLEQEIGLPADFTWIKGAQRPKTIIKERDSGWGITGPSAAAGIDVPLDSLLRRVRPHARALKRLSATNNRVELSVVIYCRESPPLVIPNSVIAAMAEIGAALDIDVILTER
ncbi:MAG: DUF4279 domain-containing protein [Terracidiphilus sp.]